MTTLFDPAQGQLAVAGVALDPRFPCVSIDSACPSTISSTLIADELLRELRFRKDSYPKRVAKGRMTQADADHEIAAMSALAADFAVDLLPDSCAPDALTARRRADRGIRPLGWAVLVACLRREILLRRRYYPDWIVKGTLDETTARHQLERLEAAHVHYWVYRRNFWPAELGTWRSGWGDDPFEDLREPWQDAMRAHADRFVRSPDNHRGLYLPEPARIAEAMA